MSAEDIAAIVAAESATAKAGLRAGLARIKGVDSLTSALVGAVGDAVIDQLIGALRLRRAIVRVQTLGVELRDHDDASSIDPDPGASPDRRPL